MNQFKGLVLAAGKGSRFQDETLEPFPKVLRPLRNRPLVNYVIDTLRSAGVEDITLVVGFMAEQVKQEMGPSLHYVLQAEQNGSGHAVACAKEALEDFEGHLVIMCGDSPLFTSDTISRLMREHVVARAAITLASSELQDPTGYGRIIRDESGSITSIVEEKCATPAQQSIKEVNGGLYAFDSQWMFHNIAQLAVNDAGEHNLTDMVRIAIEQNRGVSAISCNPNELLGVNTPEQLRIVENLLSQPGN